MYINKLVRVAFIANPRTGSREIGYENLIQRGFERWLGHHGVPWGGDHPRTATASQTGDLWWWWNEPLLDWTFYGTTRNHFEVFHSIYYAALGGKPMTPQRFEEYLWKHPALYRNRHILFPCFFEIAGCRELRFAHLRDDFDAMLSRHGLPPLKDDEMRRSKAKHITNAKPRGEHYSAKITPECRWWIEETYRTEMDRFGFRWEEPGDAGTSPG